MIRVEVKLIQPRICVIMCAVFARIPLYLFSPFPKVISHNSFNQKSGRFPYSFITILQIRVSVSNVAKFIQRFQAWAFPSTTVTPLISITLLIAQSAQMLRCAYS